MRKTHVVTIAALALLISACTGDSDRSEATGEGIVRAVNAIPTAPDYVFAIEERLIGNVSYSNVSSQVSFDDLDYIFNFEVRLPGVLENQRVASTPLDVVKDHEYTFLISGDVAAPTIIVWDAESRSFNETDTVFQARFGHTAESFGPVDVYFASPGTAPAAGEAVATLAFGEVSAGIDNEAGDYVYILTTAGDPGDVLFESDALLANAQSSFTIIPFAGTANDPGPLTVRIVTDAGGISSLPDTNVSSTVRFIHASINMETADIYADEMLMDQITANHAYRDVTGDLDLAAGSYTFTYTTAGNTGSILLEAAGSVFAASHAQIYVVGEDGALQSFSRNPDRRSVETLTKFTFTHAAFNHPAVDLYVVEAGTDIEDVVLPEFFNIPAGSLPFTSNIDQGDLELYLTVVGEKTVIAGPIAFTAELGDVFEYIAYDNVDPATADLVAIPLP